MANRESDLGASPLASKGTTWKAHNLVINPKTLANATPTHNSR